MVPSKIDNSQFKLSEDGKTPFWIFGDKDSELPENKAVQNSFLLVLWQMSMIGLQTMDWLVGCFGLNGPLRQYFSLYRAVSQREGERKEN